MALVPKTVLKTVGTTAASLFATGVKPVACGTIIFHAPSGNSGNVIVGDANCDYTSETGFVVEKGKSVVVSIPAEKGLIALEKFWADSSAAGDKLAITYMEPI